MVTDGAPIRVLLVEAEPDDTARFLEQEADRRGRTIELSYRRSLSSALTAVGDASFDAVVLDLQLPDSSGFECFEMVSAAVGPAPIIVVTDDDDFDPASRCIASGAEDALVRGQLESFIGYAIFNAVVRRRAQQDAARAYESTRRIVEDNHDAILVLDGANIVRFRNHAASTLFGDRTVVGCEFGVPLIASGTEELQVPRPDGTVTDVEASTTVTSWYGDAARLVTLRDVTERNRNRVKLEHLNRVLRAVREINQLIVRERDPLVLIQTACALLVDSRGYNGAWIVTSDMLAQVGWEESAFQPFAESLKESTWPHCHRLASDGSGEPVVLWPMTACAGCPLAGSYEGAQAVVTLLYPDDTEHGVLGVSLSEELVADEEERSLLTEAARDIGFALRSIEAEERRQEAEQAHRQSEVLLQTITDNMLDMVSLADAEGRFAYASPSHRQLGYEPADLEGRPILELVHPDDLPNVRMLIEDARSNYGPQMIQYRYCRADGEYVWLESRGTYLLDDDAGVAEMIISSRDITHQKEYELRMLAERNRAEQYLDVAAVILLGLDTSRVITMINRQGCATFGVPEPSLMLFRDWLDFVHPEERDEVAGIHRALCSGEMEQYREAEGRIVTPAGETRWVHWRNSVVRGDDGAIVGTLSSGEDVTERREADAALRESEAMLRQAQRMESVGRLAGGIAHDFNNILTIINSRAELLLARLGEEESPVQAGVRQIQEAGQRAATLTRQLLTFSRKQPMEAKVLDLNQVVEDLAPMLRRLIGEHIELETVVAKRPALVTADPGHMEQVLMNLAVNARDAMPSGGRLTLETAHVVLDASYVATHPDTAEGACVMLAVTDDGVGMDPDTRELIFEPFFTTKESGQGTGLGLSTVYGVIKQAGGNIWVYSEPGQGTTFKVYLPPAEEDELHEGRPRDVVGLRGNETVLVVEDEDVVREMVCELLESAGYTVMSATSAEDARETLAHRSESIDLLLTDVVMPRTSGRELADELVGERPGLKVLFMSGYTENSIVHHGVLDRDVEFISKPFTTAQLLGKIRQVLDSR